MLENKRFKINKQRIRFKKARFETEQRSNKKEKSKT